MAEMPDVIVIGGGPAGLMAAIAAAENGARVLLLDKGDRLGRKLAISGGGRCNVTNNKETAELIRHIPGNGRFLHSALSRFGSREIIAFFESLGIKLKEENEGRMFPATDKAMTVVAALVGRMRELGVSVRVNEPVERVLYGEGRTAGVRLKSGEELAARCIIVATGGKSVPRTGSTGDGYAWARAAGHTITPLYPTEVPITSDEPWIVSREVQGLSLRGVRLTVEDGKGKKLAEHEGDMIFTHFGLSGPAALRCSQFVVRALMDGRGPVTVRIDPMPGRSAEQQAGEWLAAARTEPRKAVKTIIRRHLPDRLIPILLDRAKLDREAPAGGISRGGWLALADRCKRLAVSADGTLSLKEAFITGGGVSVREIDPRTMESKLMRGLYFCGEILDVHGYTGGYNITAAFATGRAAGEAAARAALGED
mgnify:CR=1 FL=1